MCPAAAVLAQSVFSFARRMACWVPTSLGVLKPGYLGYGDQPGLSGRHQKTAPRFEKRRVGTLVPCADYYTRELHGCHSLSWCVSAS